MDSVEMVRELVAFDAWANRRLASALGGTEAPLRAQQLFAHVLAAHDIWWERIEAGPKAAGAWPDATPSAYADHVERVRTRLDHLLEREDATSLERRVAYHDLRGAEHGTRLHDILVHLVHHGTHHRAQVASLLVQHGLESPRLDYIVFARERAGGAS